MVEGQIHMIGFTTENDLDFNGKFTFRRRFQIINFWFRKLNFETFSEEVFPNIFFEKVVVVSL